MWPSTLWRHAVCPVSTRNRELGLRNSLTHAPPPDFRSIPCSPRLSSIPSHSVPFRFVPFRYIRVSTIKRWKQFCNVRSRLTLIIRINRELWIERNGIFSNAWKMHVMIYKKTGNMVQYVLLYKHSQSDVAIIIMKLRNNLFLDF